MSVVISLCAACHRDVHAHPSQARETGFIVSVHQPDVQQVPIETYYGRVLLRDDGSIQWEPTSTTPPRP